MALLYKHLRRSKWLLRGLAQKASSLLFLGVSCGPPWVSQSLLASIVVVQKLARTTDSTMQGGLLEVREQGSELGDEARSAGQGLGRNGSGGQEQLEQLPRMTANHRVHFCVIQRV